MRSDSHLAGCFFLFLCVWGGGWSFHKFKLENAESQKKIQIRLELLKGILVVANELKFNRQAYGNKQHLFAISN